MTVPPALARQAVAAAGSPVPGFFAEPASGAAYRSAVLVLIAGDSDALTVLLLRRAAGLRRYAGDLAFPGGAVEPGDAGPVATALREAAEEIGIAPGAVDVLDALPSVYLAPIDTAVIPVLGWWRDPARRLAPDPTEVAAVLHLPVTVLGAPSVRRRVRLGPHRYGPGFALPDGLVWGLTASVLAHVAEAAGWFVPGPLGPIVDRPDLTFPALPDEEIR